MSNTGETTISPDGARAKVTEAIANHGVLCSEFLSSDSPIEASWLLIHAALDAYRDAVAAEALHASE